MKTVAKSRQKLRVEIPNAQGDSPHLGRLGGIVAVGFAVGLLLPALAGKRFVPEPPVEERGAADVADSADIEDEAPPAAAAAPAEPTAEADVTDTATSRVEPGKPLVLSCRDQAGKAVDKCDELDLSSVVDSRLLNLGTCAGTEQASGTLSIGFEVNFGSKKIERILRGKSTTIASDPASKLYACAEKEFASAAVDSVEHKHTGYTVFYKAQLFPPGNKPGADKPASDKPENEASGLATVTWNSAVIRDKPGKDSNRVASILRGTRVTVVGRSDNWYRIKYDASGSEGWVYKDAIGM